MKCWNKRQS